MLDAVDDLDVGAIYPFTDVAGHEPAVLGEGFGGLVGLVPVADEHPGVLGLDLAGVGVEAQPDVGIGLPHRAELDATGEVAGGDGGVLGHAVELEDRHTDAHEELKNLGGDGRRTGRRIPAAAQTDALLDCPEDERLADPRQDPALHRVVATVGDLLLADRASQTNPEAEERFLEPGGIVATDVDAGVQALPDAGHGEEDGRLDFAQVQRHRVDRFGEIERRTGRTHGPGREDPLGDVAQREIGEDEVVGTRALSVGHASGFVDDLLHRKRSVCVGEHGALRRTGGARGVDERHDVVGSGL